MVLDYGKLGLKCGLEIHQQLDTKKLFCNCPSVLRKDAPDFTFTRKLHAIAGESGEIDVAVAHEASKDKEFVYEGYHDNSCLVELDEEPPRNINQDALKIGLQIATLLNTTILPIAQVMRKTVIDGSNTSGFQRTVLIARDGWVETPSGKVGIATVCLEEDSARTVSADDKVKVYRLDRLGIPLVEIATEPEIRNPSQAKEVALKLGEILRACSVKRGLGTIRQDVNLSVKGGKRIELKGFQDIRNIETAIEKETERQIGLVEKKKSVAEVRKVNPDGASEFLRPMPGAARMYPETDLPLLKISRYMMDEAKKNLPKIGEEIEIPGLNKEMMKLLLKSNKVDEFKELLHVIDNPSLIAKIILIFPREIASREKIPMNKVEKILTKDVFAHVLENVKKGKIAEHDVKKILGDVVKGKNYGEAVKLTNKDLGSAEEKIMKIIKDKPGLTANAYMGLVMKEFGGKISGKEASEIIRKHIQ